MISKEGEDKKEEILNNQWKVSKTLGQVFDNSLKAMDEHARQMAICFARWMDENNYGSHTNGFYFNESPKAGKQTWFTIEELFDEYLKSLQQH